MVVVLEEAFVDAAAAAVAVPWQEGPRVVGHAAWGHAAVPFAASC